MSATSTFVVGGNSTTLIERWAGGEGQCCRLLIGKQRLAQEDVQALFRLDSYEDGIDNSTAFPRCSCGSRRGGLDSYQCQRDIFGIKVDAQAAPAKSYGHATGRTRPYKRI